MSARKKDLRDDLPSCDGTRPNRRMLFEDFRCDRRKVDLQLHECMTDYVNANALRNKTSPCFSCQVGLDNRSRFAKKG